MVGDQPAGADVVGTDAADQGARGAGVARRHDLALDQGRRADHPGDLPHRPRGRVEISEMRALAIDREMAVEAEDAVNEIGAKPVHHRHDDDQGRHPERDAE